MSALLNYQAINLSSERNLSSHVFDVKHTARLIPDYPASDLLFETNYDHNVGDICETCSRDRLLKPTLHQDRKTIIHYGTIASDNQVIKDAKIRDQLSSELDNILVFKIKTAGIANGFSCFMIRGVCDYTDSYKQKQ